MEIILLKGRGLMRYDIETLPTRNMVFTFVGSETPELVSVSDGNNTVRKRVENGSCKIDLRQFVNCNVRIMASTALKLWNCGCMRIEEYRGGLKIRNLTDYAPLIDECMAKIQSLDEKLQRLEETVDDLCNKGTSKSYKII